MSEAHGAQLYQAARIRIRELEAKLKEREQQLGNLLARIHRDGGHHLNDVGYEQACLDADEEWVKLCEAAEVVFDSLPQGVKE
jgi:hypothetical protein